MLKNIFEFAEKYRNMCGPALYFTIEYLGEFETEW
jgi:hypothetical protein